MTEKPRYIYRAKRDEENPYFQHRRATAQDRTLTFEARGMLSYLLSQPDTWRVQPSDLEQQCKKSVVYRILKELIEHGYIDRQQERDEKKKIIAWHYIVYEEPLPANLLPRIQEIALPEVEKLEIENQDIRDKKEIESRESNTPLTPKVGDLEVVSESFDLTHLRDVVANKGFEFNKPKQLLSKSNQKTIKRMDTIIDIIVESFPDATDDRHAWAALQFYTHWASKTNNGEKLAIPVNADSFGRNWRKWLNEHPAIVAAMTGQTVLVTTANAHPALMGVKMVTA